MLSRLEPRGCLDSELPTGETCLELYLRLVDKLRFDFATVRDLILAGNSPACSSQVTSIPARVVKVAGDRLLEVTSETA